MPKDFFSYGNAGRPASGAPAAPAGAARPAAAAGAGAAEGDPPRAILADLDDTDWEKFIGFAARRRYPDGAGIVAVGDRPVALGFVASGAVVVQAPGGPASVRGEGEAFGVLGFLDGAPSTVAITARGTAEVLLLGAEALTQLSAWQPRIALALLRDLGAHVAGRLRRVAPAD